MNDLHLKTIHEVHDLIKNKEITSLELTETMLKRTKELDSKVDSFLYVDEEGAINKAKEVDKNISEGKEIKPLTGIPVAVKDLFVTKGIKTTAASKILYNYIPPYNATVVDKLLKEGSVITGKLNMDEFAMGSSTEYSAFKKTKNPFNLEYTPGGSSGGSAACVAADLAFASLGSDTGGSIRQPASHNNILGLKPTYGRVSRFGMIAYASSLDQAGPFTKDAEDMAIMLNAIAGVDKFDSTTSTRNVPDYKSFLNQSLKGLTIGIPKEYLIDGIDKDVMNTFNKSIEILKGEGVEFKEITLPHTDYVVSTYYLIATAEASSNLARFDGIKYGLRSENFDSLKSLYKETRNEGFGKEVKRRILLGTFVLSSGYYDAYYLKAQKVRTLIKNDFVNAFSDVDLIMTPVTPTPPFKFGEKMDDPVQMYLSDIFTLGTNLAGLPGISIPAGFSANNLPIGIQLIGNYYDEGSLIKVASAFEKQTNLKNIKPIL